MKNCLLATVLLLLIACNFSNNSENTESSSSFKSSSSAETLNSSSSFDNSYSSSSNYEPSEVLIMDSRVIAYREVSAALFNSLGFYGFITADNKDVLNAWFPDIFNEEQTESECNYFAKYNSRNSLPLRYYYTLTKDDVLHITKCTREKPFASTDDRIYEVMLICDDKEGTLRNNSFERDPIEHEDPDWICGIGGPKREDIFF